MRVGVYLRNALPQGMPDLGQAFSTAREAIDPWSSEPLEGAAADVCDDEKSTCLAFTSVPIGALDAADQLLRVLLSACEAAERAAEAMAELQEDTPFLWLRRQFAALSPALEGEGVNKVSQGRWAGGRYLQIDLQDGSALWATAFEDGALGFHWRAGDLLGTVPHERITAEVGGEPWKLRKYRGVRMLNSAQSRTLLEGDGEEQLRDRILAAFDVGIRAVREAAATAK